MKLDHKDAADEAAYKRANSNLARCYLDLRATLERAEKHLSEGNPLAAATVIGAALSRTDGS